MLHINLQGEELILLPGKALYWPKEKTLIAADLHWGKTAHFRKNGIAIPINAQHADESRLSTLVTHHAAERLIIAGDMFHSRENNQVTIFSHWRLAHNELTIDLVLGNHDKLAKDIYTGNNMTVHEEVLDVGPFLISHDILEDADKFYIHGHIHPRFAASGKGRGSIRLACFCMNKQRMILPSFGSFTGGSNVSEKEFDHIYLIAEDEVIQWC